jgi:hypothetical protein
VKKVQLVEIFESFLDFSKLLYPIGNQQDPIHCICLKDVRYGLMEIEPDTWACVGVNTSNNIEPTVTNDVTVTTSTTGTSTPSDESASTGQQEAGLVSRFLALASARAGLTSSPQPLGTAANQPAPSPDALRAILAQTYESLLFLHGRLLLEQSSSSEDLRKLRLFLRRVVPWCLSTIYFDTLHCTMLHTIDGMEHFPERANFLKLQNFYEMFFCKFTPMYPQLLVPRRMMIMYNQLLVWTSLPTTQSHVCFKFLSRFFVSEGFGEEGRDGYIPLGTIHVLEGQGQQGYQGSKIIAPIVYLDNEHPLRMVALKRNKCVLVFFLSAQETSTTLEEEQIVAEALQKIQLSLQLDLDRLLEILEEGSKRIDKETQLESTKRTDSAFIYFNPTNLVVKVSPKFQNWAKIKYSFRLAESNIPLNAMQALDICRNVVRKDGSSSPNGTYCAVVTGDYCIVGYRSGTRELYRVARLSGALMSSSQEAFFALPPLYTQLEKLIDSKFANVLMI